MSVARYAPHLYVWVARWGRRLGSDPEYIAREQVRASQDGAPLNAIHRHVEDAATRAYRWATTDEITNARAREELELPALPESK